MKINNAAMLASMLAGTHVDPSVIGEWPGGVDWGMRPTSKSLLDPPAWILFPCSFSSSPPFLYLLQLLPPARPMLMMTPRWTFSPPTTLSRPGTE